MTPRLFAFSLVALSSLAAHAATYRMTCAEFSSSGTFVGLASEEKCQGVDNDSSLAPGCELLQDYLELAKLDDDVVSEREMQQAWDTLCQFGAQQGSTVRYPNGTVATNYYGQQGASWFYPNGKTITSYAGQNGATWFYPNGKTITSYSGQVGATWFYPNGRTATSYAMQAGATWFYPSGKTITSYAGQVGATWFYPNGKTITSYMGQPGATWYRDDGTTWMSSGPALTAERLKRVPSLLLRILSQQIPY